MEINYNLLWLINWYFSTKSHDGFNSRAPHATLTKGKSPLDKPSYVVNTHWWKPMGR